VARGATEQLAELPEVEEAQDLGLLEGSLRALTPDRDRRVEDAPGESGAWNAIDDGLIRQSQRRAPMGADAASRARRHERHGHLREHPVVRADAVEGQRRPVREQGART
jgi:hypothetical protein